MTPDLFSLEGKIAIVTGALGLLGRQHCIALGEAGAQVVAADVNTDKGQEFGSEIEGQSGHSLMVVAADITDPDSVEGLKRVVVERYGGIDILINNAAVDDVFLPSSEETPRLENYPLAMWKRALDVNLTGTFLCSQIIGSEMARAGQGSIINIASTYGVVAPDQAIYRRPDGSQTFFKSPVYPATKGAVISLTRYLATYWGRAGVRVNSLSPGGVENSQESYFIESYSSRTPLGRMAQSTDYRGAILFLASGASSYMTGANLVVDGGWTAW